MSTRRWVIPVLDPKLDLREQEIVVYVTPVGVVLIPPQCGACILPPRADDALHDAIRLAREAFDRRPMGTGPTTSSAGAQAWCAMSERSAEPGERCTCGRQAITVFIRGDGSEVGYCGRPDGGDQSGPCPFCGGERHCQPWGGPAPCPQYRLRTAVPSEHAAAERCIKISPGMRLTCLQSLAEGWITASDLCPRCTRRFMVALESAVGADEPLTWHHAYAERAK